MFRLNVSSVYMLMLLFMASMSSPVACVECGGSDLAGNDTFDVYLADKVVGELVHKVEFNSTGATTLVSTTMAVSMGNAVGNSLEVKELRKFNLTGALVSAYQEVSGPSGVNSWAIKKTGDRWDYIIIVGGVKTTRSAPDICGSLFSACKLLLGTRARSIKKGDVWFDSTFEMVSGQRVITTSRCIDVDSVRLLWTFENTDNLTNRTEKQIVDKNARTLQESIAGIYTAKNRDKALASLTTREEAPTHPPLSGKKMQDISELFSIPMDRFKTSEELICVTEKDTGFLMDSSVVPWYVHSANRWILQRAPERCGSETKSATGKGFSNWLIPTISMQSNDPKIIQLANTIKGNEKDICVLIDKFTRYVNTLLLKRNTATFSNALETLKAGYGDCGEHAALLGALLRAAGIPARVVLGLVYVESKKAYMYHAWVMARAGEWVFADAALGVFPALNSYVPLIIDDTGSDAMRMIRMLGKITIDYSLKNGK